MSPAERAAFYYSEFEFEMTTSRGAGGQHVNKTNSAVLLRWSIAESTLLSVEQKERLLKNLAQKLTVSGELLVRSEESRSQDMNRKKCLEKVGELIARGLFEQKKRRATKPTRSSQRKRVDHKVQRGEVKKNRGKVSWD